MGRQIFISYKYSDRNVRPLFDSPFITTTARHYVDELQAHLKAGDHVNKGEADDESLAEFKDTTIQTKLKDKIYWSSVTIVLITPNMKEVGKPERDQWIPWEISYSLRNQSRNGRISGANAIVAVVLPDASGSYYYYLQQHKCLSCRYPSGCVTHMTGNLFSILSKNMFNQKQKNELSCSDGTTYSGEASYIPSIKWDNFISNIDTCLDRVSAIRDNIDDYEITKKVTPNSLPSPWASH